MKNTKHLSLALLATTAWLLAQVAGQSQSGTWTSTANGNWSDINNWNYASGPVADGAGSTADFSTLDLAADIYVTNDVARTIGTMIFADTVGNKWWYLPASSPITLDAAGGTPTITVTNMAVVVRTVLTGTSGLLKDGAGTLNIDSTNNTYSGGTTIGQGTIGIGTVGVGHLGTGSVTITNGSTLIMLRGDTTDSSSINGAFTNALVIPTGHTGTIWNMPRGSFSAPVTGDGTLNFRVNATRGDVSGNWSAFTGQINVTPRVSGNDFRLNNASSTYSFGTAAMNLGAGVIMYQQGNYSAAGQALTIGEVSGSGTMSGGTAATDSRLLTYAVGGRNTDATFNGRIQNATRPTAIIKQGSGTWALAGTNTFTGATLVNSGKLVGLTGGSISNTASFTVASGATNGVKVVGANGQWTTTNLIYNAGATCLELNLGGTPSTTTAPLNVLGALTANSAVSVLVYSGNLTAGSTYPLVKYGSLGGAGYSVFTLAATGPHFTGHLVDNSASQRIDLVVDTVTQPVRWAAGSADWDINATSNWVDVASSSTTYQEMGGLGDIAVFEDAVSGTAPISVNIPVTVSPASVIVSNDVKDFTFSGVGRISSTTTLVKLGTNILTMSLTNSFTGGSSVGGGAVSLATLGAGSAGLGTGSVLLSNAAALVLYSGDGGDPGTGAAFANALNVPSGQTGTIWNAYRGSLTGPLTGGGTLNFRVNGNRGDVSANWSGFTGPINITARNPSGDEFRIANFQAAGYGRLNIGDNVNFHQIFNPPTGSGTQTIQPIGELSGTSLARLGGNPVGGRFVNWTVGSLNTSSTFAGTIADDGGAARLTKVGTGTLILTGTNTHTGFTIVSNGTLQVDGAINASIVTNFNGTTLAGTGFFGAAVDMEAGSRLSPGVGGYGVLTFNGGLSLNGATNLFDISTANSDLLVINGGLNVGAGTIQLNISGTLTKGTYKLATYDYLSGGSLGNLTVAGFSQPGRVAGLVFSNGIPNEIWLEVDNAGGSSLTWVGDYVANYWDVKTTANWTNAGAMSVFRNGDFVTFNDPGASFPSIDLRSSVQPGSVTVSGSQYYTFDSTTGAGKLSGGASLIKSGSGTLTINTPNDNSGPITINAGGTLQVGNGANNASIGTGVITNHGTLVFAQGNSQTVSSVSGSGSLTQNGTATLTLGGGYSYTGATVVGWAATLQVGTGGATGPLGPGPVTLDGTLIMNQSGTFSLTNDLPGAGNFVKSGASTMTLSGNNTYFGNTYVNNGVLKLASAERIPDGGSTSGWLILDAGGSVAGTLDLNGFNESVNALAGLGGTVLGVITNTAPAGTNTLVVGNDIAESSYSGMINENPAGAKIALVKRGAAEQKLVSANAYSGGTLIQGGRLTLRNGLAAGTNQIVLTNGGILNMTNNPGNNSIFVDNDVVTPAGTSGTLASDALGCGYSGLFFGSNDSTNFITGHVSVSAGGSTKQFQNFTGAVILKDNCELRFSASSGLNNGGDNTAFEIESGSFLFTRNAGTVNLGALSGTGNITKMSDGTSTGTSTFIIGAKNVDSTFSGTISSLAPKIIAIVKTGSARLTLDGTLAYEGSTTISNGVLAIAGAAELTNTSQIFIRQPATLDMTGSTAGGLPLGQSVAQTLTGSGTVAGNLTAASGSTVRPGDTIGTLMVSGTAQLGGDVVMELNRTNSPATNDMLSAASITASGTLTVTNLGLGLQAGDKFKLFSVPVSGFTTVNLPQTFVQNGVTNNYVWTNKLAADGTIEVLTGFVPVNTAPTNITSVVSGGNLTLGWPIDHTGWRLQTQTNALGVGLGTNWSTVAGSTTSNTVTLTIDPANPTVFFRLVYP